MHPIELKIVDKMTMTDHLALQILNTSLLKVKFWVFRSTNRVGVFPHSGEVKHNYARLFWIATFSTKYEAVSKIPRSSMRKYKCVWKLHAQKNHDLQYPVDLTGRNVSVNKQNIILFRCRCFYAYFANKKKNYE